MAIIETISKNTPKYEAMEAAEIEFFEDFERTTLVVGALAGNSIVFAAAWLLASG